MKVNFKNYKPKYSTKFYDLNIEWLEKYFYVEDHDKEVLRNPEKYIINQGGIILFAEFKNHIIGTAALMPTKNKHTYELTKMAVNPNYRNKKIGQKILLKIISTANKMKLKKIILYSNRKLENAIHLYLKYNFKEINLEENCPYDRANIKMKLCLSY
jgi:N-acetylglutamate synthase-like GNAT family acetyltransferase